MLVTNLQKLLDGETEKVQVGLNHDCPKVDLYGSPSFFCASNTILLPSPTLF